MKPALLNEHLLLHASRLKCILLMLQIIINKVILFTPTKRKISS